MNSKVKAAVLLKNNLQNFLFVLPAFAIFCTFYIYPFWNIFVCLHLGPYTCFSLSDNNFKINETATRISPKMTASAQAKP